VCVCVFMFTEVTLFLLRLTLPCSLKSLQSRAKRLAGNNVLFYAEQDVELSTRNFSVSAICVTVGPRFALSHETTAYAWAGRRRNVTCRVSAEPDVVIEWLRAGQVIEPNETFSIIQTRAWRSSIGYLQVCTTAVTVTWLLSVINLPVDLT